MDFWHVWASSGARQKLCFLFLLAIAIVVAVRALRATWWRLRATREADVAALLARRRSIAAASSRGLAEAAFALTCAGAASGLITGSQSLDNSSRNGLAVLSEQWLDALALSALAWLICGALFAAVWAFEPAASDSRTPHRALRAIGRGRRLLWPLALVLVALAVFEMRGGYESTVARVGEPRVAFAVWEAIGTLWRRTELLFTVVGVVMWLSVLVESAVARRFRLA